MNPNIPPEALRDLRAVLYRHGFLTTIGALAGLTHDFGADWATTAASLDDAYLHAPLTSMDQRAALLGVGKIRIAYTDTGAKIQIIKVVRIAFQIGLKEAKEYTEAAASEGVTGDYSVLASLNDTMEKFHLPERFTMD